MLYISCVVDVIANSLVLYLPFCISSLFSLSLSATALLFFGRPQLRSSYYTPTMFNVLTFVCIPSAENDLWRETKFLCLDNRVA